MLELRKKKHSVCLEPKANFRHRWFWFESLLDLTFFPWLRTIYLLLTLFQTYINIVTISCSSCNIEKSSHFVPLA